MPLDALLLAKGIILFGLGTWLLLAAINNFVDPRTNLTLLKKMMTMAAIKHDNDLGVGLLHRAVKNTAFVIWFLKLLATIQLVVAILLLASAFILIGLLLGIESFSFEQSMSLPTFAMTCFMSLWLFFMVGGLWFGYWIKMGMVQIVHLILLVLSLLILILLNLPSHT
ncbi:DUF2165 family protein [Algibacillus agarilyticus]|uniref:DUF2165 family protein n=1 Tax=Algibacillus agarilyticus TaxID=2234133 RepID=UPI000DCF6B52|nr:DUF2165 family protein [Algibacillus agarilyticus]